jgi:hypothetical protein
VDFSLQDIGSGGWGGVPESFGGSGDTGTGDITSALENIGVNFAAGAATVGLGAIANNAGVSSSSLAYGSSALTRRPGTASPYGAALGASGNTLILGGLLIGGLLLFVALRKG